uniref:3-hydroxybenzoate 6-hydroxylase 1 n=3 Tax=Rhizophora mucronata TaxID=61149 RepID=A0A2P2KDB8_RHIMU
MEELDIVIVGGGICGLATALALYRKGIRSVVLERSETLRVTGAAIVIFTNGWRALDELGVAWKLRQAALPLQGMWDIDLQSGSLRQTPLSIGEARCLRRSDLMKALADDLPADTIRFSWEMISVKLDADTSLPVLNSRNGSSIRAKVLIGCDGLNSVVADFLELKPKSMFLRCGVRGFTNYPNGHGFAPNFIRTKRGDTMIGRSPVDDKLVFWFASQRLSFEASKISRDPEVIRQVSLEFVKDYPSECIEMIENCDLTTLSFTRLRYRAPWDVLLGNFRRGNVIVAGDAMHVMGPFLGQGGSAALEDAVVLARCLAQKAKKLGAPKENVARQEIGEALDQFVKERRMRLFWLSLQTYLLGSLLDTSSTVRKVLILVVLLVLFRNPRHHREYDCGRL